MTKDLISSENADTLYDKFKHEQPCRDIDIHTRKKQGRRQIMLSRENRKHSQCLMRSTKDFVDRSTQEKIEE